MSERKPLFLNEIGDEIFQEEISPTDDYITLSGVQLTYPANDYGFAISYGQEGVVLSGLDVSGNKITNLADGVALSDAATVGQLSAMDSTEWLEEDIAVDEAISIGDPVYWTATGDRVGRANASDYAEAGGTFGVAKTAQAVIGNDVTVVTYGLCENVLTGATGGDPYYLQSSGGIGTSIPRGRKRIIQVGRAKNSTDLFVKVVDYGRRLGL